MTWKKFLVYLKYQRILFTISINRVLPMKVSMGALQTSLMRFHLEGRCGRQRRTRSWVLLKQISDHRLKEAVQDLIIYFDSCGGHNYNIKVVILSKKILSGNGETIFVI